MIDRDIAIVGMAGRFPDARNIDELYVNLRDGKDSIRSISSARLKQTTLPEDKNYNIYGYMETIDVFDFALFGISKGEAESMDPHQRQLLEVAYETFENAGYNIDDFNGSNTAVYIGDQMLSYYKHADEFNPTLITGNGSEFLAGRISRFFNLTGAVAMVDTSCSSSLVALHNACSEIILGNADTALVCGVNLELFPLKDETGYHSGTSSPDGTSRPFSANANGMVFGEAVVSVLLKPYQQA
jgi:acyl transferase domain-containing protein